MHTRDFDYHLPDELIAREPAHRRDESRLLHIRRGEATALSDRTFRELPELLSPGDVVILNDTRVVKARLLGHKADTKGKAELLIVRPVGTITAARAFESAPSAVDWVCMGQSSKGFRAGMQLDLAADLTATIQEVLGDGHYRVRFSSPHASLSVALRLAGELPLPPYLDRPPTVPDDERYQTVFAKTEGSVAAPTAGLHFTEAILARLEKRGIACHPLTLEVGPGTFLPMREGPIAAHVMHEERVHIPEATVSAVIAAKANRRRVVAIGTTVVRSLEGAPDLWSARSALDFSTSIFIQPGYEFKIVDALLTNFHLPQSTLLVLVSAFMGRDKTMQTYQHAIDARYRFYSYGDAMLIE